MKLPVITAPAVMPRSVMLPPVALLSAALGALLALSACSDAPAQAVQAREPARMAAASAQPVVVELFQSQGCSSCPPANRNVNALADRPGILALNFSVTYWDRLGWKDIFGQQAFTDRQWDYARKGGRAKVYTPQVIINGRRAIVGSNPQQLSAEIGKAGALTGGPAISVQDGSVGIGAARAAMSGAPATVWLVRYDPRQIDVPIKAGENGGKTLPHRNVVRDLIRLGSWDGKAARYALPASSVAAYRSAILVQADKGGPMIAARKL